MMSRARFSSVVQAAVSAVHVFSCASAAVLLAVWAPIHAEAQSTAPDAREVLSFPVPTYPEDANWHQPDA